MKVSIIIPVYNTSRYLEKCVESAAQQTLKDIEIICIDDGSTDDSLQKLNKFAEKYNNIKVIHKENGGVSSARNLGLDSATGEFVGFLDSDDYVDLDFYEKLYEQSENYDFVRSERKIVKNGVIKRSTKRPYGCMQSSIVRKSFIDKNKLRFDINLKKGEDSAFKKQLYKCKARTLNIELNKINSFYYHCIRLNSLSGYNVKLENYIDGVLLYVDSSDINWQQDYEKAFPGKKADPLRYQPDGSIKYLFRAIDKNIKCLRKLHFVVSSRSQVPEWVNEDTVHIVEHKDFIPTEYLPTFNSNCIAAFISKIPDLGNQYIMINDDTWPSSEINVLDLFNEEGLPIFKMRKRPYYKGNYRTPIRNSIDLLTEKLGLEKFSEDSVLLNSHTITPSSKALTIEAFDFLKDELLSRNTCQSRSLNELALWKLLYVYFTKQHINEEKLKSIYFTCDTKEGLENIKNSWTKSKAICVNSITDELKSEWLKFLEDTYPEKSRFEK